MFQDKTWIKTRASWKSFNYFQLRTLYEQVKSLHDQNSTPNFAYLERLQICKCATPYKFPHEFDGEDVDPIHPNSFQTNVMSNVVVVCLVSASLGYV
jgi:hypothetical protein